jgi:hypothetical protein
MKAIKNEKKNTRASSLPVRLDEYIVPSTPTQIVGKRL